MSSARIIYELIAKDRASGVFGRVGSAATGLQKKGSGVGAALAKGFKVGGIAAAGLGFASLKASGDFEKSMNQVRAVSGATGKDFTDLREQAKQLGATTKFSATQAADGMGFLAMAGFKTKDILSAMPGVLSLASAGNMDLAQSADIASNILTGYGFKAKDTNKVVDILAKTFTSTNTNLEQLGEAMKYAGPVAHSAGLKFEESAAAIGLMGNAGIQASMAGTSLRGSISRLLAPTDKIQGALDKLGVKVTDAHGKMLPLADIIEQLGKKGASTSDLMTIFGQRAGPAMAALIDQGAPALRKLTGQLEHAGGTADRIAKIQMEGLQGQLVSLKSAWEGLMIEIGDLGILKLATGAVEGVTTATRGLTGFVDKHALPAIKGFRDKVADMVPLGDLKQKFADAKTTVGDFFSGLAGKGTVNVATPRFDKAPMVMPTSQATQIGQQIRDAISGGISGIDWGELGGSIGSGLAKAVGVAAKGAVKLTEAFGKLLGKIDWVGVGISVGKFVPSLMAGFVVGLINFDFGGLLKGIGQHWQEVALAVLFVAFLPAKWAGAIGKALGKIPFAGKLLAWGFESFAKFGRGIKDRVLAPVGRGIADGFKAAFPAASRAVGGFFSGVAEFFVRNFGRLKTLGGLAPSAIAEGIRGGTKFVTEKALQFGGFLLKGLKDGIIGGVKGVGSFLKKWIVDPVVSGVKSLFGISSPSTVFASIGRDLVRGFKNGITGTAKAIGSWAWRTVGKPVVDAFKTSGSWLWDKGKSLVSGFKSGTTAGAKAIVGFTNRTVISPVTGAFKGAGSWLWSRGKSLVSGFKSGSLSVAKTIGGWLGKNVISPITGAFKHAGTWLWSKGGSMISGLVSGTWDWLKAKGHSFLSWAGKIKDKIVSGIKSAFGIHSPSKVMMGLGGHIMSGLWHGMLRGKNILTSAVKGLFKNPLDAAKNLVSNGVQLSKKWMKKLGLSIGLGDSSATTSAQQFAQGALKTYGWGPSQWPALKALWQGESGWRWNAKNPSSGAYGIPQALPASKMASAGSDWRTNASTQIRWGLSYIKSRYGSPANAWSAWQARSPHWYDSGGYLPTGASLVMNGTGRKEPTAVFTQEQWDTLHAIAAGGGNVQVKVYVGDQEIRDIVRVETTPLIKASEQRQAFRASVGRRP
ncbi:phage tail tape measure protein [Streptomyces sp. NBC_00996]|uniref:phage tail tape measure protein n=1 Tax=Streptomyces sp. NBC_00996 TaxID=2903710 RepID=UPI00386DECD5|nr:phage tail tape measure protein [Streptomyces sp. NBC_00996]